VSENNDEHPEKHSFPSDFTEFGIMSDVNDKQPGKQ
jgi:hypothetical protein